MHPLEEYVRELNTIHATGAATAETSSYGPLANLLNAVGQDLKPRIHCLIQLQDRGAGIPDGGLFSHEQVRRADDISGLLGSGQVPAHGVVEVKAADADVDDVAAGEQVERYLGRYRQVLVTNYWDFLLVAQDPRLGRVQLERYRLAEDADAFRAAAHNPRTVAKMHGARFVEFLRRVMLHAAPLAAPRDVAWFLASYARDALARIADSSLPGMKTIRAALEEALGMQFQGEKGDHFFRSTLVQTLFYGVFSAWVLWSKDHPPTDRKARFDWHAAEWSLHVPMVQALYHQIAGPYTLGSLGIDKVLDWTATALNRVDRAAFFAEFEEGHAVQYFYEPFLEAYDPALRKELGVWYTPPEIVEYMVERVDRVLRAELGIADGLADPNVYVLDPCCGTGAYLVAVLRRIHRTLDARGDALTAQDLKAAARERVFGFEILPAPFVVSHMQLGLYLRNAGAPLAGDERVGVYLTNALTGWEPPKGPKQHLTFPEMEEERDAAERVKREAPILVILGNPPYNAFAGTAPDEEGGLVDVYKDGLISDWGIRKFNLDDLYVRFFRIAERRIAEKTGRGIVSFISNMSWVSEPSFVVLRRHLLRSFDNIWIENMHGNRKISEYAPDGRTSETVFAIAGLSPGIKQGVATTLWVKTGAPHDSAMVRFRDDIDAAKAADRRADLLATLDAAAFDDQYETATPTPENRYSFRPEEVSAAYNAWPKATDLCAVRPFNGPIERRGNSLVVLDPRELTRLRDYLDASKTDEEIRAVSPSFMKSSGEFKAEPSRQKLKGAVSFDSTKIRRYPFKPFDVRWAYLDGAIQPLFSRPNPELLRHSTLVENAFFITRDSADKDPEGPPFLFASVVCDYDSVSGHARHFPVMLARRARATKNNGQATFVSTEPCARPAANLSTTARTYLKALGIADVDDSAESAGLIWMHALAIGYSGAYLAENADGIRRDWPRIPLPATRKALEDSAALGRQVAALLDTEHDVAGVTSGALRPELRVVAPIARAGGGNLRPEAGDLAVTAGWGHAGRGGVTMPGKGDARERDYTPAERAAIAKGAAALGVDPDAALDRLGATTFDIHLNDHAYWRNVPAAVWGYTIGGYQVMKKWLSYREEKLLGRALTIDEAREVTDMARRLAALALLGPALDANYAAVKADAWAWERE